MIDSEIEIFRPKDFVKLISKADSEVVPFLAIGATALSVQLQWMQRKRWLTPMYRELSAA